jgi:excisionase family DNA binding protein
MGLDAAASIDAMVELMHPPPQEMLDFDQVAAILGCSYGEARKRMLDGRIRAVKDGRWCRSRRDWVDEYLERMTVRPPKQDEVSPVLPSRRTRSAPVLSGGIALDFLRERQKTLTRVPA